MVLQGSTDEAAFVTRTPDRRLRVFVSSALDELEPERLAVRDAIARMRLVPVMFELGARAREPASGDVYRDYIEPSQVFVGIYSERFHPAIEEEFDLAGDLPKLIYVKSPAPERDPRLGALLDRIRDDAQVSYRHFRTADELRRVVGEDVALLLTERFNPPEPPAVGEDLPVRPGRLYGRTAERERLRELLTGDVRLVTLIGPGGVGKTSLAVECAASLRSMFADGVRFVDLSAVPEPELVPPALAHALGLRTMPNRPAVDDIVTYLRDRELLLLIDNWEHLVDAAPLIGTMLNAARGVSVMATSRVPLRLTGEHVFDVPPLPVPGPDDDPEGAIRGDGAARLFVERARAVASDFAVGPENAAAIVEIVRRLDGLPLAIELAAAKVRVLTPQGLLDRFGGRLGTLAGGPRDLPARQRTLRDTIAWSYHLLPAEGQEVFARLGVLASPFDLDAARAVAGLTEPGAGLEALGALIESSLVTQAGDQEPRFAVLGVIREYALEKLHEAADWREVCDRHARYFLDFAEHTSPRVGQISTDPEAVHRLEVEHANLRAAMNWFLLTDQMEEAVRLGWMLWPLWWLRGHAEEGARTIGRMLEHADSLSPRAYAHVLFGEGALAFISGDHTHARPTLERLLPMLRELGEQDVTARTTGMLGQLALARGDWEQARELLEETRRISEGLGEHWMAGLYHTRLGTIPLTQGDYAAATEQFADGLRVARETNDHLGAVVALYSLAVTATTEGDQERAAEYLAAGLQESADARDEAGAALYLAAFADLAVLVGDEERAVRLAAVAQKLQTRAGAAWMQAYVPPWPARAFTLDTRAYARAYARGTADTLASAVAYALGEY
ncbi:tetratricopeptide repeat protein [Asanoa sp. WMMD1127]|uniref:tetratricopeptide repeat protein n=1 Tax=Asanoa sp. WMMD1127 TaxID=3016107 RepID=UPI0024162254|nr:tetratricopeptide repeat protein [Asanoa sp. WMMD1127]MDG4825625.1 tetratricopeptide repeat protein [Asanoa sp. WMMD1127]